MRRWLSVGWVLSCAALAGCGDNSARTGDDAPESAREALERKYEPAPNSDGADIRRPRVLAYRVRGAITDVVVSRDRCGGSVVELRVTGADRYVIAAEARGQRPDYCPPDPADIRRIVRIDRALRAPVRDASGQLITNCATSDCDSLLDGAGDPVRATPSGDVFTAET